VYPSGIPLGSNVINTMIHYLEFEEILPVRQYKNFAEDVKNRWK